MVNYAADLKLESGAPVTNFMLSGIAVLDSLGAWEWNLRVASLVWFAFFASIRHGLGKKRGVEWYALVHAIITGVGGVACSYLSFVMSEELTGTPEPLNTILCGDKLTSLHRVLPPVTLGFAILDLVDGMSMDISFMTHGIALFTFALYMCENDRPEILAIMLTLEFSSIFFNFTRADFLTPKQSMVNLVIFVITFFFCRIIFGPWSSWQHIKLLYTVGTRDDIIGCHPPGFRHFVSVTAVVFNLLNFYWFVKIIQKLQRKIQGKSRADQKKKDPISRAVTTNGHTNGHSNGNSNGHSNGHSNNGLGDKLKARKED